MKENIGMILEHYGEDYGKYYHAIVPPIFMNSLHVFDSIDDYYDLDVTDKHSYCYGRVQNPTVRILEDKIAALESGEVCYTFSSGMAAATAAIPAATVTLAAMDSVRMNRRRCRRLQIILQADTMWRR